MELGRLSETGAGREAGAKAAFGLALMLGENDDIEGALQAYRDSVELGRLSETSEGFEARSKASYNLNLLQEQVDGTSWSS